MKPKRLTKLEADWQDRPQAVEFDNDFDGSEWMVYVKGHFANFEIKEISDALRAANKAENL